ncbi:MAG: (d)CMP kinase [Proteobacteria bacterium]|nr:(d)CMP kinase [Pseudomonadota bacterium]
MIEVVTIDGPSGSGKSTASKLIAKKLGYNYLDTGAMYRAFALIVLEKGFEYNKSKYVKLLRNFEVEFKTRNNNQRVYCEERDITEAIRMPDVSMWASTLSKEKEVRDRMFVLQRKIGENGKIVAEGRDMGTVVFKDAFAKFFLNASLEVRAERRWKELKEKGINQSLQDVINDIQKRDEQDTHRDIAPLKPAEDALIIDTSELTLDEVVSKIYENVIQKLKVWKS